MKITPFHITYWAQHRMPRHWPKGKLITVNELIPSGESRSQHDALLPTHTLLVLCRSWRKRGVLREKLQDVARSPETTIRPERRAATAKTWLARMRRK